MYDLETAELIRTTPELEGLDRDGLPELFTEAFAQISSARVRLREKKDKKPEELIALMEQMQRLSYTNEALISILPEREDRNSAAFVAATAHHLCMNANRILKESPQQTFLERESISSDISAMLLFMIAEAMADAAETARQLSPNSSGEIEAVLIRSLQDLACGNLVEISKRGIPDRQLVFSDDPAITSVRALYRYVLEGVHSLANQLQLGYLKEGDAEPEKFFSKVCELSIGPSQSASEILTEIPTSVFSGPRHLAKLLSAVSKDLLENAVVMIPAPENIDEGKWQESMQRFAAYRPFLWRNHRDAIAQGYLQLGVSAAVGFPTGAGKSTLSELKINTALLANKDVIFIARTHALVDQTTKSLSSSFPAASVQKEREDDFGFLTEEELPDIFVMTPESCLTQISIDASIFKNVGLFVFDECHLLHSGGNSNDRRSVDAMLCVLNISNISNDVDFLFLSAMMKNAEDIAGWISELTGRSCLSLTLPWKPTRQLRGSVVYRQDAIRKIQRRLNIARETATTKNPSAEIKRELNTKPLALFSLKQTWASKNREDYALVGLLDNTVQLAANKYWRLTPNAVEVSSSIAAASVESGVKTLVFFQTIKNAVSAAKKISDKLEPVSIKLRDDEAGWLDKAITELGGASHLYIDVKDGRILKSATVHHGLLLPEERHLCESLYKRKDGIRVLTATYTLAQGMNLPSELVIIGEDSRFDQAKDRREILEAQELLNAAGRAGRAGENASGVVLVVPGKVVGFDDDSLKIGAHWAELREIFSQSDQCLDISDPLTSILDHIYLGLDKTNEIDKYAIFRLASGAKGDNEFEALSGAIKASFAAYISKKKENNDWLLERINSAKDFLSEQKQEAEDELVVTQVAATLGLSLDLVKRLSESLSKNGPDVDSIIPDWRRWFFRWLSQNPDLLEHVFRRSSLIELFGKKYEKLEVDEEKASHYLPIISKLTWCWMRGDTLKELEKVFGTHPDKIKTCEKARKFVLRLIPELSYLFGLPALLHEREQINSDDPIVAPSALFSLGRCVRLGFNFHEKAALNQIMRKAGFSRRQLHHYYASVKPYLTSAKTGEVWEQTLSRVETASNDELHARGE